jgi:uncharacterized membrane protein HdeD (DUF308 family)
VLSGSAGIAAGFLTFFYPVVTAYALLYIMAVWAIISGVFEIVAVIEFRRVLSDMWLLGLAGALSIALGILLAAAPGAGLLSLVWLRRLRAGLRRPVRHRRLPPQGFTVGAASVT